jgi:hypothetical protein
MRRAIQETPEEAQEDVSSRATSTTVERVIIPNEDFMALLAEYGPDAPIPEAVLAETVGDVTGAHRAGAHAEEDVVVEEEEGRSPEEQATVDPDSGVGFLLRRQKTVRPLNSRSRSASPRSRPESPPAGDDVVLDESVQPPPAKEPRVDPAVVAGHSPIGIAAPVDSDAAPATDPQIPPIIDISAEAPQEPQPAEVPPETPGTAELHAAVTAE